jgi:hypothetical protein
VNEAALAHFAAAVEEDPLAGVAYAYHGWADSALHDYNLAPLEVKTAPRPVQRGVQLSPEESRCQAFSLSFIPWFREYAQPSRRRGGPWR